MRIFDDGDTCIPQYLCGGQRMTLWSQFSPSTFPWVKFRLLDLFIQWQAFSPLSLLSDY